RLKSILNRWGAERVLVIQRGVTDHRVHSPRTWRLGYRKSLNWAKVSPTVCGTRLPFLSRNSELYVDSPVNLQELTIQLLLISCQWGWAQDVNVDDYPYIVEYVCGLFKRREQMRLAVERSVSYLFTNFVMPQNAGDFRLYIRRVVHDQPRRERADSGDISPRKRGESGPQKPCTDPAMMRRRSRAFWVSEARSPELLSPRSLASECEMHYQRIYEAIGRGEIEKIKWRGTL